MFQEIAKVYPLEQVTYALLPHFCLHHIGLTCCTGHMKRQQQTGLLLERKELAIAALLILVSAGMLCTSLDNGTLAARWF